MAFWLSSRITVCESLIPKSVVNHCSQVFSWTARQHAQLVLLKVTFLLVSSWYPAQSAHETLIKVPKSEGSHWRARFTVPFKYWSILLHQILIQHSPRNIWLCGHCSIQQTSSYGLINTKVQRITDAIISGQRHIGRACNGIINSSWWESDHQPTQAVSLAPVKTSQTHTGLMLSVLRHLKVSFINSVKAFLQLHVFFWLLYDFFFQMSV